MSRRGFPSTLGAMGDPDLRAMQLDPERTYLDEAPFGSMDPGERIEVLDAEGIDAVVLYTTIGLLWEAELDDAELSQAYTRAYNRWICEFCADSPRLVPTAHLSLSDPAAAAAELERAVGEGARGALRRAVHPRRPAARPSRQRPGVRRRPGPRRAVRDPSDVRAAVDQGHAHGHVGARASSCGCSRRSPRPTACASSSRRCSTTACSTSSRALKVVVLESGGGWIGYWLDRIDAVYGHTFIGTRVPLEHKPSDYFRERVWISCDPDERTIPRARRAVRRRPVHVGVGLPARRPHARVHHRSRRARRRRSPTSRRAASSSATTPATLFRIDA